MTTSSEKTRILVVDEVVETTNLIRVILQRSIDCEVYYVDHPTKALAKVVSENIDLVLCEAFIESSASHDFCRNLKGKAGFEHVPVILYSGLHDRQAMMKGFEAGAVDFLFKPLFPMELAARVKTHFLLKQQKDLTIQKIIEQRELIHLMCHDLTGPIGASLTLLELSEEDPEILTDNVGEVINSLQKAMKLTELVRQFQAIADGKADFSLKALNLKDAILDASSVYKDRLENKGLAIANEVADHITVMVEQVSFVNSVLANLLGNAIKFSYPESEITFSANEEDGKVRLSIEDTGIGIPENLIGQLFDLNKPTSRSGTKNEKGTGYGLPLVKKFVTLYGGTIDVHSKDIETNKDDHGSKIDIILNTG